MVPAEHVRGKWSGAYKIFQLKNIYTREEKNQVHRYNCTYQVVTDYTIRISGLFLVGVGGIVDT